MNAPSNAPDANDVLFGQNSPAAKFETPGTTVGGTIASVPRSFQEREYDRNNPGGGELKYFKSGDPIMGIAIDVQTQLRDPSIDGDNGIRTIYVQGKRLKDAVRNGVRAGGGQKLEVGAEIHVTFTHLGEAPSAGANQPKEWSVRYVPVAQAALGLAQPEAQQPVQQAPAQQQPATAAQPPVQQVAPATQTNAAPAAVVANQAQIESLLAAGVDPRVAFPGTQLTPEQLARVPQTA